MTQLKNKIKTNFILFEENEIHVGCGLLLAIEEKLFCITAGHVVFGKSFNKKKQLSLKTLQNIPIKEFELLSTQEFAEANDLALFRIWEDAKQFSSFSLSNTITNSRLTSLTFIKASLLKDAYFLEPLSYSDTIKDNEYMYKAPNNSFNNFDEDEHGAAAMEGISGSPIILNSNDGEAIIHGVLTRVPNKGVGSLLAIRSITPLVKIIDNLEMLDSNNFDGNHKLINYNKELLKKERFSEWVNQWKELPENKGYYKNLVDKLKVIHGEYYEKYIPIELEKIMIGDEIVKNNIETDSMLAEAYKEVITTAERDCMHEHVTNASEALKHYKKVGDNHLEVIKEDLAEFAFSATDRKKIAHHNVATWMAVCHLRFTKK